ncbi:MAG TPA: S9 family peptidase [Steroidobacteraceae bacterium]|nr:S9 family peptidase [Steroidobacteraceae bacterium]
MRPPRVCAAIRRCAARRCLLALSGALGLSLAPMIQAAVARAFNFDDLIALDRVADPRLSPDGRSVAYQLLETDLAANRTIGSIWLAPVPDASVASSEAHIARRLTAPGVSSFAPRWRGDGKLLFFLSTRSGNSQVWRLDLAGGEAQAVTHGPLEVGSFMLAPDGKHIVVAMNVFPDCDSLDCTKRRLEERATQKDNGRLFERLFVRHWDSWANGTRSQLFAYALDEQGIAWGAPVSLTQGIDADVPSKPFGDDSEWSFTPDSRALIFTTRIAGSNEPWSTNFDLYRVDIDGATLPRNLTAANPAWDAGPAVSPDGRTLAYRAMKRPGFEADRFGIMLKDLSSGATRELLPNWDRSSALLRWSGDGRLLYTVADEDGQRRLFMIDVERARIVPLTDQGTVRGFDVGHAGVVYALDSLGAVTQLFHIDVRSGRSVQFTHHNQERLAGVALGDYQPFSFRGWNGDIVHGYVVKPVGYQPGRKYPVLLLIHGGPENSLANEFHYRWNAQAYAGAGYAVVLIDFHGSLGYGQAFTDAVRGHWGDRPLEDLQKGWSYALSAFPYLDGSRACALGGSFGGYMTNWIEGNWRLDAAAPWRCLVTHEGVFDSRMMYYSSDELWFEEWEHEGTAFAQPQNFERFNPVDHVADWSVPMLVIHGGQDFRVPLEQGVATFTALQRRGIPSEFLYFPDENHWLLKPQHAQRWFRAVQEWLAKWTASP